MRNTGPLPLTIMRRRCAERVEQKVERETWNDSLNRRQKLNWDARGVRLVRQHGRETVLLGVAVAVSFPFLVSA